MLRGVGGGTPHFYISITLRILTKKITTTSLVQIGITVVTFHDQRD